ncbi:MBL fold metallo-hydrolase [Actinomadura napierensis]|uniref:Metallo-beta-lactamase domain-containing protein n=1 Tax=Actinomadura napierensis TaxID=267854 RepID=A0ABP5JUG9_9ACTN
MPGDGAPGDAAPGTVAQLLAADDRELEEILAAADTADLAMHAPRTSPPRVRRPAPGTCEMVLLGSLGCRYGMLAGGAGGHLVRTASASVLVDPGPAALHLLLGLAERGLFHWSELDAICVTHFHPDHYTDLIPCLEGMAGDPAAGRKLLVANPTAADRFRAFSPYHAGGMADLVTLAHPRTEGDGEPSVKVGDLTIHATPALHTEETGRTRSAIGLAYRTPAGGIWYTSDTSLAGGLLGEVAALVPEAALVIAHADATNLHPSPERTAACHLETRDVPAIAAALHPGHVLIHHYDAAYAAPRYRIAQAVWLQRELDRRGLPARVLPSAAGMRLTLADGGLRHHHVDVTDDAGAAVAEYLRIA